MSDNDAKFVIVNGSGNMVMCQIGFAEIGWMLQSPHYVPVFFDSASEALECAKKRGYNQFVHAETMADFIADNAGMEKAKP